MKIRKLKQAWIFCRMTKRGRKNYRQRVAYRKAIKTRQAMAGRGEV